MRFCGLGLEGTSTVVQTEAFDGFSHWTLAIHGLDDFGRNRLGVVCGISAVFSRQNIDGNRTTWIENTLLSVLKSCAKQHRSEFIFVHPLLTETLVEDAIEVHPSLVHDHYVARSFGSFRPTHSEQFLWTCHAVSSVFFCLLVCFLFFAQLMGYPSCADLFFIKMFKSDLFNGCTRQTTSCVMGRNCSSVRTASDRHAADESSISRCGKGFFSHCHLSVQTLLRVSVYSRVQSHALTPVRSLKIL